VIHSYHMSKKEEPSFTEYVIHTVLSSSDSDLFVCYSVLPGNAQDAPLPSVMGSVFVSVAVGVGKNWQGIVWEMGRLVWELEEMTT